MIRHLLVQASWVVFALGLLVTAVETGMLIDGSLGAVL